MNYGCRWFVAVSLWLVLSVVARAHRAEEVILKPVTNASSAATAAPVTFGVPFGVGDIPKGKAVAALSAGRALKAQVDIKRHYADGSVRFAIVSLLQSEGRETSVAFAPTEPAGTPPARADAAVARQLLAGDFDAVVTFAFPDGASASASARTLLESAVQSGALETWLSGPVATEFLLMGAPVNAQGTSDPDLNVQFQVRCYEGCKAVRVSVVVENCWDTWAGNIGYDVTVALGKDGKVVLEKKNVDHESLSRWRRVFWWPEQPAEVHVAHSPAGLFDTKALPNFDLSFSVPEKDLAAMAAGWASVKDELFSSGFLARYMGMTGGRDEINFYPVWTVRYLMSQDPRAKEAVLGNGDAAGAWPIHVRNSKTKRLVTIDERPEFWLDGRGRDKPVWKQARKPMTGKGMQLQPDAAHLPSLAYVPFLVTGDYYYLEEAWFWANWCLLAAWPEPRQKAKGILDGQIRGNAWSLRELADAGYIAPDETPEAAYFEGKVHNNLRLWTAQMLGPPERNANGFWGERPAQDHSNEYKNPPKPWMLNPPWQVDYLAWSLCHLAELGYTDAVKPRDFLFRWRVGLFTHPDVIPPVRGTTYRMVVGEMGADKKVVYYDDWKKLGEENVLAFPNYQPEGRDYYDTARAVISCAIDTGYPKAEAALRAVDSVSVKGHTLAEERSRCWTLCPKWTVVPRAKPSPTP